MLHRLAIVVLPRQGHLFQTTSIGRRKALKNVHLYTCSPCAKRHINIVTLLVDIYMCFFSYGTTFCGTIILEQHLLPVR